MMQPPAQLPLARRVLIWCGLAVCAMACCGVLGGQIPARARLLGLFALGEGILTGAVLGWLARRHCVPLRRTLTIAACVLGTAAFGLSSAIWSRQFSAQVRAVYAAPPADILAMQLHAQGKPEAATSPEAALAEQQLRTRVMTDVLGAKEREEELRVRTSFGGWLVYRLWGSRPASVIADKLPGATAVWLGELIGAGVVAAYFLRRALHMPYCATCQHWREPIRSHEFSLPLPQELAAVLVQEGVQVTRYQVVLANCHCANRRPDVTVTPLQHLQRVARDRELVLDDEQFCQVVRAMDVAQGMSSRDG